MKPLRIVILTTLLSSLLLSGNLSALMNPDLPEMILPESDSAQQQAMPVTGNIDSPAIGRQLFRSIRRHRPLIEDPELTTWITQLVDRLAIHAPGVGRHLYVAIVDDPSINAFVLNGGIIIVHSGLILSTDTESELAAVISHELAHLSQRHLQRMVQDQKNSPLITGLGLLAGAVVASKSSEAAQAILSGTMAIQAQQQISYSQQYESEADRVGLRILAAARLNPNGMPAFLEKLDQNEINRYGNLNKYLRSHPLSIDRLSDTRHRANNLQVPAKESIDYLFAREKLRALQQATQYAAADHSATEVARYQQALQQFNRNNHRGVIQLLGTQSQQLAVALLSARSLNAMQRFTESERLLKPLFRQHPQNTALAIVLAQAVAGKGDRQAAWQLLSSVQPTENTGLEFFEAAQYIAQQADQAQEAVLYHAERNLRIGEYRYAQLALEQALRGKHSGYLTTKLERKLAEVKQANSELNYLKN